MLPLRVDPANRMGSRISTGAIAPTPNAQSGGAKIMTSPDTTRLLAQLRTLLDLTHTEIQIAETLGRPGTH
jgi:hypothetical protein